MSLDVTQNKSDRAGTVYWITGLPGAGKTTLARKLSEFLKRQGRSVISLDGDSLREILACDSYEVQDRKKLAGSYSRLARNLSEQGFEVVIATVSLFHDIHQWNRQNISAYKEIFLDVPKDILIERDQKGLYTQAKTGQRKDVVGMNQSFEVPTSSDLILKVVSENKPDDLLSQVITRFQLGKTHGN